MNDRELLELAAKAAGAKQTQWLRNPAWYPGDYAFLADFGDGLHPWMPLISGDDALRLAMKLGIQIIPGENYVEAVKPSPRLRQARFCEMYSAHDNPLAATRYAIVRAAAEIGSQMK